jgi:hypothetical protein
MTTHSDMAVRPRRTLRCALLAVSAVLLTGASPIALGALAPAHAQASVSVEFREALGPYGEWRHSGRWGDVWVPRVEEGWRPYTVGHWVYTNDWGWYWDAAEREAQWGWVVYHYGRWIFDPDLGWAWIPDTKWGPSWVVWRRGHGEIGWAPMPPERLVVEYREDPHVWIFVRNREFIAPDLVSVVLPPREVDVAFRETVVVNETVVVHDSYAVNPGIEPAIVAAAVGRPLHSFDVRPQVLAGTPAVPNAVQITSQQIQQHQVQRQASLRQTQTEIRPTRNVPPPQPLSANEHGRLGQNPPRAANAAPNTAAPNQTGQLPNREPGTNRAERQPGQTQGTAPNAQQRQGELPRNVSPEGKQGALPNNRGAQQRQGELPQNRTPGAEHKEGTLPNSGAERLGQTPRGPNAEQRQNETRRGPNATERQKTEQQKRGEAPRGPVKERQGALRPNNRALQHPGESVRGPGAEQRQGENRRGPGAERQQGALPANPRGDLGAEQRRGETARGPGAEPRQGALRPSPGASEPRGEARRAPSALEGLHGEVRGPAAGARPGGEPHGAGGHPPGRGPSEPAGHAPGGGPHGAGAERHPGQ